jgi:putative flippase GtrA
MFLTILTRIAAWLPAPLARLVPPPRLQLLAQFMAFGCVGTIGMVIDTITVYTFRYSLGLYGAGVVAYFTAATGNWALNRIWTFRGKHSGPIHHQWARFLVANALGFVLNRGTYAALVTFVPLCASEPVYAIAAGGLAGMFLNFSMSRRLVYKTESN